MEIPIPQDIAQKVQEMRTKPYRRKEKALEKLLKKKHHGVIDATKLTPAGYEREKRLQFKEQMSGQSEDDNSWAKHALHRAAAFGQCLTRWPFSQQRRPKYTGAGPV